MLHILGIPTTLCTPRDTHHPVYTQYGTPMVHPVQYTLWYTQYSTPYGTPGRYTTLVCTPR